jgi:carbamoyl-phosphate synthase large subunit
MNERKKVTVAVTGLNNIDSPGPGIPVIRGLLASNEYDVRIIGLSYEAMEPGIYMRDLVAKTYQLPTPANGQAALMNRLRYIHAIEKIDVIIPNFDSELFNFIKLSGPLSIELGIRTFLPTLEQFEERHKWQLDEFGEKYGVKVPKSKHISSAYELQKLGDELEYPLVVKGKYYDAAIAYSLEQAVGFYHKIAAKWGLPIIVQAFTKGTEVNVTAIGDGNGNTIGAVAMRKQVITDKGKAWAGITIDDEKLLELTHHIIRETKWRGPCEMEVICDEEDNYFLIEINPRFPAWVYLAVGAGQNHPEALLKLALGEPVKPFLDYEVGKLFIRYSYDMICNLEDFMKISTLGEL